MENIEQTHRIAKLNDEFRSLITSREHKKLGMVVFTSGVINLQLEVQLKLIEAVRDFKNFDLENDPYQEHDFESITINGGKYYFKIDYYAPDLEQGSVDPSDPDKTYRVLTIMEASEY